jgi:truncated hemoglobin YjbI
MWAVRVIVSFSREVRVTPESCKGALGAAAPWTSAADALGLGLQQGWAHISPMTQAHLNPSLAADHPQASTDLQRLGGPQAVKVIMERLVDQMVTDVMIGFFFAKVNVRALKALETAYAISHLGGPAYRGRDVGAAHGPLPIGRGHFDRRLRLLGEILAWAQVPQDVQKRWLGQQRALLPVIVGGPSACPADG